MPNPVPSDLHVDAWLTNVAVAYFQSADDFIADKVFPIVPVQKQSDLYVKYRREDFWRDEMQKRAPATESAGGGWQYDRDSYFADVWAYHKDIADQERANADSVYDLDRDSTNFLSNKAMIRRDAEWVSTFFQPSLWDTDLTGVTGTPSGPQFKQWSSAGSTPIADIRKRIWTMKQTTGYKPNTLVLGPFVWSVLQDHPDFTDRIKGGATAGQPALVNPNFLAQVLEIDRVVIASGVKTTSNEGAATPTFDFLAGKHALLAYAAPAPSLMSPSAGYTFSWTGYLGAGPAGQRIKSFRMDHLEAQRNEIEIAFDAKLVSSALGAFFGSAVA